ncbi:E3 ubiquitin-protein ligase TRIM21 isoform X3 [Etheostoma spectabile]|uniref:E3 ubiquitin-protein ligase TRIM21 isoform X3 n=1 Tax=Etheostoma spectabile TaxID=54343 RepID=UPI0013AF302B|nr:E3 ubiquitin-protein ligase TRIM21-like isoform X3 [Etheostoma spectabile]
MTTVDLFNTLEDLGGDEFMKFKWYLQQDLLEGYQSIKVSKLENAERLDTVDVMVNTYQLDGARKVTKKVLEMMNRKDLVQSLPDTSSGPRDMAAVSILSSEDQFLCSICLDVFTDPVTTPCGHNFCKNCITEHWNTNDQNLCPLCKERFTTRPDLKVNTLFSEMVAQFRQSAQQKASSSSSEQQVSKPGEVPCDVCTGTKLKAELGKTEAEIQQMIQKRRLKIQEIKHSVDLSDEDADREIAEGVQVFTSLKESVERGLNELINTIKEKQKTREKQAVAFITELEQEISELRKRSTEVEQMLRSEDHLHLLQRVQSLNIQPPPPTKDWTEVSVRPSSYEGTVVKTVAQLEETLSKEMKKLLEAELKRVQQYAVDVTLDPDTAHPKLILSDDGKQVNHGDVKKNLPDNPERFSDCCCVLGKQSFSSGRFYFEVQVKGKTAWDLGVARESISRKGNITLSPQTGYRTIWLRNGNEYNANDDRPGLLSLKSPPQKVGVFVDYEEGLVSFYDVDAAALIYSFTGCSFTEKLFPYFCPCTNEGGKNSAPLIISPVTVN